MTTSLPNSPTPRSRAWCCALDQAITRRRRAGGRYRERQAADVLGTWVPPPLKPTRIELAVFTVLAQTYGPAVLHHPDFTPVLEDLAECGAVVLVQRALWGERSDDVRLAARLLDCARSRSRSCAGPGPRCSWRRRTPSCRASGHGPQPSPWNRTVRSASMAEPLDSPDATAEKLTLERRYTTKDFTALRAYVQRIAPAVIARTYYDPDDDPHAATPGAMERHLTDARLAGGARDRPRLTVLADTCVPRSSGMANRS